ncbi:hypothetical protein [Staphylococcus carnosus]|uniref:Uncharacterized protein n=2 Tax=Staphylococcus carnosus TaxID=1281 RepID=B9DIQ5_STACT|nr:hypothetical protein [Staphylococcus carnosus]ANZ33785.1 hypothetical protein BEK99_08280 [Staphylococcus carnosus]KKB24845.1 hypothetical protein VV61_09585 [Staphylococcus carnosus]KOR14024.1 hypothetical protein AMC75_03900 [Staphylococcus carnosus]PNZ99237.1 hypothetical protein CD153_10105 [Staphylococcus carnosus]QPT03693.1 hypothetical protein I6G40_11535 [Staphylococcus carnosus]
MRIYVNEIKVKDDGIYCYTDKSTEGLKEAGQMLVDSDNYGFAYILDDGQSYSYLIFVKETWSMLHENKGKTIYINDDLKLEEFDQELDYILSNIKGNSNYGKDFVAEVEEAFELE